MILNFSKKFPWGENTDFVDKIDDKIKVHSIREDKSDRWKPGKLIHLTTGSRTKYYDCFNELDCISVQSIEIKEIDEFDSKHGWIHRVQIKHKAGWVDEFVRVFNVIVDGRILCTSEIVKLARNDGFDSTHDFFRWFNGNYTGKIIHWTDLRY
ncbi:hypothetical protein [Dysgonomonas macrotermitis]|uniref:ASCH domain-containing protein n=1 Tax=Dysgonomonas macrotermitis TaxID=1346286 RepID=A0A1M4UM00_9BACT|nr:hypothetical protein [Dysgonomonas macrotermitis]SHE57781.1 hypothetical protein SAMN05444362_101644 [Dysgonomonas macrotermitis]